MAVGLKAIETHYKGYRFRSRLEARWAVFFDALNVVWEYEREGFELESGRYLPDFWLPASEAWVEIKGSRPTKQEMEKCTQLAEATGRPVHVFFGQVAHDPFWTRDFETDGLWGAFTVLPSCKCGQLKRGLYSRFTSWGICHGCDEPFVQDAAAGCPCRPDWYHCERDKTVHKSKDACYLDKTGRRRRCRHDDPLTAAYDAVRAARFEYGESGATR